MMGEMGQGAMSGAAMGSAGGPWGALAGAVLGTTLGAIKAKEDKKKWKAEMMNKAYSQALSPYTGANINGLLDLPSAPSGFSTAMGSGMSTAAAGAQLGQSFDAAKNQSAFQQAQMDSMRNAATGGMNMGDGYSAVPPEMEFNLSSRLESPTMSAYGGRSSPWSFGY